MRYEQEAAVAVIGLASFQLLQAWNANAPTLSELRAAHPGDVGTKQRLMDADFMVGGLALIVGTAFAVLTRDATALIVLLVVFGLVSLWFHSVGNGDER